MTRVHLANLDTNGEYSACCHVALDPALFSCARILELRAGRASLLIRWRPSFRYRNSRTTALANESRP